MNQHPSQPDENQSTVGARSNSATEWMSFFTQRTGLIWAAGAGITQAAQLIATEAVVHMVHPMQALFIRSCFLLIFVLFISWNESQRYTAWDLVINISFGLFDAAAVFAAVTAMSFISAADAGVILFNQPIPSSIAACVLLGESFDWLDGVLTVINCIGLVCICKTTMADQGAAYSVDTAVTGHALLGILSSAVGLGFNTLVLIAARSLAHRDTEDPCLVSFMAGCNGLVISSVYLTLTSSWQLPETNQAICYCILLGMVTILCFYIYMNAVKMENVLIVAIAISLCIPLNFMFEFIFKGRTVFLVTLLGVVFTVGSTVLLYIKTFLTSRQETAENN